MFDFEDLILPYEFHLFNISKLENANKWVPFFVTDKDYLVLESLDDRSFHEYSIFKAVF